MGARGGERFSQQTQHVRLATKYTTKPTGEPLHIRQHVDNAAQPTMARSDDADSNVQRKTKPVLTTDDMADPTVPSPDDAAAPALCTGFNDAILEPALLACLPTALDAANSCPRHNHRTDK